MEAQELAGADELLGGHAARLDPAGVGYSVSVKLADERGYSARARQLSNDLARICGGVDSSVGINVIPGVQHPL
jgi:hypothetical protein